MRCSIAKDLLFMYCNNVEDIYVQIFSLTYAPLLPVIVFFGLTKSCGKPKSKEERVLTSTTIEDVLLAIISICFFESPVGF
jgi:hypothetical protein